MSRWRAPRICSVGGCPNPVEDTHSGTCRFHKPKPYGKQQLKRRRATGVSSGWQEQSYRKAALQRDKFQCQKCGAPATVVDHITPISQGGTWLPSNLQSLCDRCHEIKTAAERGHLSPDE